MGREPGEQGLEKAARVKCILQLTNLINLPLLRRGKRQETVETQFEWSGRGATAPYETTFCVTSHHAFSSSL